MSRPTRYRSHDIGHFLVLLGTLLVLGGCNDSGPTTTRTTTLTGAWRGTWTSIAPAYGGTAGLEAQLTQSGSEIHGSAVMVEHLCVSSSTVSGTIDRNDVRFSIQGALGDRTEFVGTLSADGRTLSGTYRITGGPCRVLAGSDDNGTWTMTRD